MRTLGKPARPCLLEHQRPRQWRGVPPLSSGSGPVNAGLFIMSLTGESGRQGAGHLPDVPQEAVPLLRHHAMALSKSVPPTPPFRQPRGKWMVSSVNSHANAARIGWHLWEIDLRFAPGLPPGWLMSPTCAPRHVHPTPVRQGYRARDRQRAPDLSASRWQGRRHARHRNVLWYRGGLVFEAHRLLYHSA